MKRERLVTSSRRAISALKQGVNKHDEKRQQCHNNSAVKSVYFRFFMLFSLNFLDFNIFTKKNKKVKLNWS